MSYYQAVVIEYLRADRALFVNTECCIQLHEGANPDTCGPHWYSDAVACDFRSATVFLCEITYSLSLGALMKRLAGWHANWALLQLALRRDSHLPPHWPIRPWLFVPERSVPLLLKRMSFLGGGTEAVFVPRITPLELVQPWRYRSWDRVGEAEKPELIPEEMRV